MPQAAAAVWGSLGNLAATKVVGSLTAGALLQAGGTVLVSSLLSRALVGNLTDGLGSGSPVQMNREPNPFKRAIYGRIRSGGFVSFPFSSDSAGGEPNAALHLVQTHAAHLCDRIEDVLYVNDIAVHHPRNGAPAGAYSGNLSFNPHEGADDQTVDLSLQSVVGSTLWSNNHRGRGVCYTYTQLGFAADLFPGGVPNLSFLIRGYQVYDPRDVGQDPDDDSTWVWSDNVALCLLHYLCFCEFGPRADYTNEILPFVDYWIDAANACDESVATANPIVQAVDTTSGSNVIDGIGTASNVFPGMSVEGTGIPDRAVIIFVGGTYVVIDKDATATNTSINLTFNGNEPRYRCSGSFETNVPPRRIIDQLVASMAGELYYVGGGWVPFAGVARTAETFSLGVSDLRPGRILAQTRDSVSDTTNRVRGVFTFPGEDWMETDYTPQVNATYLAQDGGYELWKDLDLTWVQSPRQAQYIAKIALEAARQDITVRAPLKMRALRLQPGDVVGWGFPRWGFAGKEFRCTEFNFRQDRPGGRGEGPALGIDAVFREYAAAIYDFNEGEETTIDPAPNTDLPPGYDPVES